MIRRFAHPAVAPMRLALALGVTLALALPGCALLRREPKAVSIDARPTPAPADSAKPIVRSVATPESRTSLRTRVVRDTTAAGARMRRCAGKKLLPEQESTWDATARLVADARVALLRGDLPRAASLARNARQLSTSLVCR